MKIIAILLTLITSTLFVSPLKSQVGIGTTTPDTSAILDLYADDKGLLLPRLSSVARDLITLPANGLIIFNTTTNDVQINSGTPAMPLWSGLKGGSGTAILSVTATGDLTTESTTSELIPGMTLSPPAGTYLVLFNGQYGLAVSEPVSTVQAVADLTTAYNELMALTATNTTHAAIFGNGETIGPGVYEQAAAASLAATLTLDGGGDPNSLFVFRVNGALTSGAGTTVILTNGASAENIFWVSQGALSLAAMTIMKGTLLVNNAAVAVAANSELEGRMFSTTGAISFGPGTAYIPTGNSYIDLGVLSTFVMFTSSGAVANTSPSEITGDVGSNLGAITGFEDLNGNIYTPGGAPPPVNNTLVTFSIFQNGLLVANSTRTSDINTSLMSLQAIATIQTGEAIDIRWHVDEGPVNLGNRIMTLVLVN